MGIFSIIPGIIGAASSLFGGKKKETSGGGNILSQILGALGGGSGGAGVSALTTLLGGAASGAEKAKDRAYKEKRWQTGMDLLSPEGMEKKGYIPTYKGLQQSAPLLNKLIGGMIGKYFGGEGIGVGANELMGAAGGDMSGQAPLQPTTPTGGARAKARRVPQYFKKRYAMRGRGNRGAE